jgi:hypothetical protein
MTRKRRSPTGECDDIPNKYEAESLARLFERQRLDAPDIGQKHLACVARNAMRAIAAGRMSASLEQTELERAYDAAIKFLVYQAHFDRTNKPKGSLPTHAENVMQEFKQNGWVI